MELTLIDHWHQEPGFIQAVARRVEDALARFPADRRQQVTVIFTAHSLPARVLAEGDPYHQHCLDTAAATAAAANLTNWQLAFQSASDTGTPWLGPDVNDVIKGQAGAGAAGALVCPVGFVADHLEIFYDLDFEAGATAKANGLAFGRTASLNDAPDFLEALADAVVKALAGGAQ